LQAGRDAGSHPLVAGLLIAIAAGFMALELSKVFAFLSGGLTAAIVVQQFVPSTGDPLLVYLTGGLLAVLLFRMWMLVIAGFGGTLLGLYCGLGLGARFLKMNVIGLASQKTFWVNVLIGVGVLLSVIAQTRYERFVLTKDERKRK